MLTVATCRRGHAALAGIEGIKAVPLGEQRAPVLWRRHGTTGAQIAEALPSMAHLAWLHTDTAGVDDLPLTELAVRSVTVTKTSAYTDAVAEWIVTAVLMAAKDAPAYLRASDGDRWRPGAGSPRLVAGSSALMVGAGEIGRRAAAALRGMDVGVELVSRSASGWRSMLGRVDWLILACPLTERTRGLVGAAELAALKHGAWLINVARGEVVDEEALAAVLDAGDLGGAVLDTFAVEPLPPASRLWGRPNVVVLPHDAWRARGAGQRQVADFFAQLHRWRAGLPLQRTVNPVAGY